VVGGKQRFHAADSGVERDLLEPVVELDRPVAGLRKVQGGVSQQVRAVRWPGSRDLHEPVSLQEVADGRAGHEIQICRQRHDDRIDPRHPGKRGHDCAVGQGGEQGAQS
jgi:hypothetical protein